MTQANTFSALEQVLNVDFKTLEKYFSKWHFTLNSCKLVAKVFHLTNGEARRKLDFKIGDIRITSGESLIT